MCGSCWPTYPNFSNPTLNIKMVFGEKIPKMGTFSDFVTIIFVCSPEPKAQGELIVWDSSRRPSVRPSVRPHFQT